MADTLISNVHGHDVGVALFERYQIFFASQIYENSAKYAIAFEQGHTYVMYVWCIGYRDMLLHATILSEGLDFRDCISDQKLKSLCRARY